MRERERHCGVCCWWWSGRGKPEEVEVGGVDDAVRKMSIFSSICRPFFRPHLGEKTRREMKILGFVEREMGIGREKVTVSLVAVAAVVLGDNQSQMGGGGG